MGSFGVWGGGGILFSSYMWSPWGYFSSGSAKHRDSGTWARTGTGLGTRHTLPALGRGAGLEAGAGICLARQPHLAVLRDLPLQGLLEIGTCERETNTPTVRAPGSARAPPGGERGHPTRGGGGHGGGAAMGGGAASDHRPLRVGPHQGRGWGQARVHRARNLRRYHSQGWIDS